MKSRKYLSIIAAIFVAATACFVHAAAQTLFPVYLSGLEKARPDKYYRNVKKIPQPVLNAFGKAMGRQNTPDFEMADRDGKWNETDFTTDESLPFRRLIWAVEVNGRYVIHYEMGGFGWCGHFLIAAPDRKKGTWAVVWSATSLEVAQDYEAFISQLRSRKLSADPTALH
jgi:hypothetical protein